MAQMQLSPDNIRQAVAKKTKDKKLSRKISLYLIRKHTPLRLEEIAVLFEKISKAGVSALYNRVEKKRITDKRLGHRIKEIEKMLKIET
ncbi:MAG TPA: hypothetical protein DCK87_05335 [Desulfotomaculum sp.]|nr:hypothetical protein [Desulfotomaculum sp.]